MNNIEERIKSLKANVALSDLVGPDELTVTVSDLSALIAQLEAAQKELKKTQEESDIHALRSEAASIIGLLTTEGHQTFTLDKVADFFDDVFRELEAAQRRIDELEIHLKEERAANGVLRTALSAANEKLKGEQVPYGYYSAETETILEQQGHANITKEPGGNWQFPLFTAPQKPVVFHPANDIANIGDNRHLWHQRDLMWQSAIKAAGFTVEGE